MKKQLLFLGLSILLLSSCGTETKKVEKSDKYNYHEIVECDIPVAKRFDSTWERVVGEHPYNRAYAHVINREEAEVNMFSILKPDKKLKKRFINKQYKKGYQKVESKYGNFEIYKFDSYNPVSRDIMEISYMLMSKKTYIRLAAPTEAQAQKELMYLLDYCQQTWKTSKKREEE